MKIAYVSSAIQGETDRLLSAIAGKLQADGKTLAGIVKEQDHIGSFANGCDMKIRVLPSGPVIKITQDLGAGSDACRLDPGAIAEAVSRVEMGTMADAFLFILNKFGPEESAGRGFCNVIGTALEQGIPVLVGVGGANKGAFETFAGGLAVTLAAEEQAVLDWLQDTGPNAATSVEHSTL